MDFCNFYGISLPQLLSRGVDSETINNLASYLNNSFDKEKLVNFKSELDCFVDFFNRIEDKEVKIPEAYTEDEKQESEIISVRSELLKLHEQRIKDLNRQKNARVKRTDRIRGASSPKPDVNTENILSDTDLNIIKNFIRYQNVDIIPKQSRHSEGMEYVRIINLDGNIETLNDLEIKIAQYFGMRVKMRKHIINGLDVNNKSDAVMFNTTVNAIIASNGERLLNFLYSSFKNKNEGHNSSFYTEVHKNVMDLLHLINTESADKHDSEDSKEIIYEKNEKGALHREFINELFSVNPNLSSNSDPLYYISRLYENIRNIDVDMYNSIFRVDRPYTSDDYENAFKHLTELGLVGLNFKPILMMKNEIRGLSFEKDAQVHINPNSECAYNFNIAARFVDTIILNEGDSL